LDKEFAWVILDNDIFWTGSVMPPSMGRQPPPTMANWVRCRAPREATMAAFANSWRRE
jgi:hypothetical protein